MTDKAFRANFMKKDAKGNLLKNDTLFIPTKMTKLPQVEAARIT